jgi:hypothetical protein
MLEDYIKKSWTHLLRNTLEVAFDPKVSPDFDTSYLKNANL